MLTKESLRKIRKITLEVDHDAAFGGKSKGNKHLERVVRIAKFLARAEGADLALTEAGAFLHDTALPSGNDYQYARNKKTVIRLLKRLHLTPQEVEQIAECAASHEGTAKPKTLEAAIVHDADVIEKTGILGIIRHTWKLTNSRKIDHRKVLDKDVRAILEHIEWRRKRLNLKSSKKLAKRVAAQVTQHQARKIIAIVAPLAYQGVITEKIIPIVNKELNLEQRKKLEIQIKLRYLR